MGNKIDLLREFYTRLSAATATGKALADVKRVQIGPREEARKNNDLPIINIMPIGGEEIPYSSPNIAVDNMEIEIALVCSKLDSEINLYNASNLGPLRYFEIMLNVLDKTTSDIIDQTYSNAGNSRPAYDYSINYYADIVEFVLTIQVETAQFTLGSR